MAHCGEECALRLVRSLGGLLGALEIALELLACGDVGIDPEDALYDNVFVEERHLARHPGRLHTAGVELGLLDATVVDGASTEIGLAIDPTRLFPDGFASIAAADTNGDQVVELVAASLLTRVESGARAMGGFHDRGTCDVTAN